MTTEQTATTAPEAPAEAPQTTVDPFVAVATTLDASDAAVVVVGIDGSLLHANRAGAALFSLSADATGPDPVDALRIVFDQLPQQILNGPEGGTWNGEMSIGSRLDRPTTHTVTVHVQHDPMHPSGGYIGIISNDVTDERERIAALAHRIEHDPTTGLINRTTAIERVTDALGDGGPGTTALFMIDIDRLSDVNDALGHDMGDRLLASTARRLATAVRPSDLVARMAGDTFLVLCTDLDDPPSAVQLAERIKRALTGRLTIHQLELDVSVSVGVAIDRDDDAVANEGPTPPRSPRDRALALISQADTAVHAAKHGGRGRIAQFTERLASQARGRTQLSASLSRALREGQLALDFQPIFSAVSELAEAAEALLRWNHPTRGRVEAGEFIPIAEETGVIVPIGDWVLRQACLTARHWIDEGIVGSRFSVHVNVSRLQLASPAFVNRVVDVLREYHLRPRQIVLEVREASLVDDDADEVVRSVRALRRVGVRVAIDNFGTGSHALSLMTDIGADVLKLDGSLALPNGSSETDTRVVRALVLLAHALNMEVVAERVTGLEQLRRLRAAGCDLVQGHLVGSPAPPDEFQVQMEL